MQTSGAETNLPLLVAGVFAATFLVVGALAYLILFREPSDSAASKDVPIPPSDAADTAPPSLDQFTLPLEVSAPDPPRAFEIEVVSSTVRPLVAAPIDQSPPAESQGLLLRLYRALMFATGIAGLFASALMFSAVESIGMLPLVALLIAAFSLYSIYRGFVPDRELQTRRRHERS